MRAELSLVRILVVIGLLGVRVAAIRGLRHWFRQIVPDALLIKNTNLFRRLGESNSLKIIVG